MRWFASSLLVFAGCLGKTFEVPSPGGAIDASMDDDADPGAPDADQSMVDAEPSPDANLDMCGGAPYTLTMARANAMLALDRTPSMTGAFGLTTKWDAERQAALDVVNAFHQQVDFGLSLYPSQPQMCGTPIGCDNGTAHLAPGTTPADFTSYLAQATTCMGGSAGCPLGGHLAFFGTYAPFDEATTNAVVLITDGQESCGGDPMASATLLFSRSSQVKTYVIGMGSLISAPELDQVAAAGGTVAHYQVDDPAQLTEALAEIARQLSYCVGTLSSQPPDLAQVVVYQDAILVPRDETHVDGWDYDTGFGFFTFYGAACDRQRAGTVVNTVVCPAP